MNATRAAFGALLLVSLAAHAQELRPVPKCHSPESMQLTREHRWSEALDLQKRRLAQIDPSRGDAEALGAGVCLRAFIGTYLTRLERHQEAAGLFDALVPEARARLGEDHPETLNAEMLASYGYGGALRYQDQISLLQGLRPRLARRYGESSAQMRNVLMNLANAYHSVRSFEDAIPLERQALAISERQLRDGKCGGSLNDCKAMAARDKQHLADSLRRTGRAAEALPLAEAAATALAELNGAAHPNTLDARLLLASVHGELGARDKALEIEKDVLALAEKQHGAQHPITRKARGNYAVSLEASGQRAGAVELEYAQLAQLREKRGPNHPETLLSLSNLSERLLAQGEVDKALPLLEEALGAMLATRSGLAFDERLTLAWQADWRRVVDNYVFALGLKRRFGDAFLVAEHFKARLLADRLSLDPAERALGEEERAALRRTRRSLASVDQALALKRSLKQPAMKEEAERSALLKRIADSRPAADGAAPPLPSVKAVPEWYGTLARVERDSARLGYVFLRGWLFGFADRGGQIRMVRLGQADAVRETAEAYRLAMRDRGTAAPKAKPLAIWKRGLGGGYTVNKPHAEAQEAADPRELLAYLGEVLLKPFTAELKGGQRLLVSPDQALAHVPFDALILDGARLGETMEVALIPSFALHARLAQRAAEYEKLARRPFLGFGGAPYQRLTVIGQNMIFQRERSVKLESMDLKVIAQGVRKDPGRIGQAFLAHSLGFPDLPGTLSEVRMIALLLGGEASYLSGERASEESLNRLAERGELGQYRVIHFAAHGFLSDDEPGLSAVVLSQINRAPGTDGYVTVVELAGLELRADLVVVSTCDSGVGKAQPGEALLGMSYALFQAGSTASLVTLWPIHDRDSASLMLRFYEERRGGAGSARALAAAKRWALAEGMPASSVDAFVLFGR